MNSFPKKTFLGENFTSAAKAPVPGTGVIAGLKPCVAQKPKSRSLHYANASPSDATASVGMTVFPHCRFLPLVGMSSLSGPTTILGYAGLGYVGRAGQRGLRRAWRECGAAEIAEAAFVLPLLLMFLFGIFQFGRMYLVYSTIQRAAMEGARAGAGSTCATCGVGPLTGAQVATTVVGPILQNAHVDETLLTVPATPLRNSCNGAPVGCDGTGAGATPKICMQRNVVLNLSSGGVPTSGTPVCGTSVRLVYPYNFSLPSLSTAPPYVTRQNYALNLKAQAQVKGED
jgi:Flp pilus assembly protein TadG